MSGYRDLTSQNNTNLYCKTLTMSGSTTPFTLTYDPTHDFVIKISSGGIATLQATDGPITTPNIFDVTNITDSISPTTGSIQTNGGIGMALSASIGGTLNVAHATDPATSGKEREGDVYFNTTTHKWIYWNGSAWVNV